MRDRSWLEALKGTVREHDVDTDETPENKSEPLPSEGCESPADVLPQVVNMQTAEKVCDSWGEEERRLVAARWKPKERGGLLIWAHPETSFYFSQEVALHSLKRRVTLRAISNQSKGER